MDHNGPSSGIQHREREVPLGACMEVQPCFVPALASNRVNIAITSSTSIVQFVPDKLQVFVADPS